MLSAVCLEVPARHTRDPPEPIGAQPRVAALWSQSQPARGRESTETGAERQSVWTGRPRAAGRAARGWCDAEPTAPAGPKLGSISPAPEAPISVTRASDSFCSEISTGRSQVPAKASQRIVPHRCQTGIGKLGKQSLCAEERSKLPRALSIVDAGLVPRLVLKLQEECEEVQELILDTLTACLRVDALAALASDAVLALRDCLAHPSVGIRQRAARAMIGLSVPLEGKVRVCEEGVIPVLVGLLSDSHPDVSASAAGSLMNAAITTQGKYLALQAGAIRSLLALVSSLRTDVCANALRALTALAEAPPARQELLGHVELLETRRHDANEIISRAAATAIRVITWTP
ncbi:RSP14 protein, partial [Atractosteus spatula]|nr:RSP14 protein [Atractosteus spatula]